MFAVGLGVVADLCAALAVTVGLGVELAADLGVVSGAYLGDLAADLRDLGAGLGSADLGLV